MKILKKRHFIKTEDKKKNALISYFCPTVFSVNSKYQYESRTFSENNS